MPPFQSLHLVDPQLRAGLELLPDVTLANEMLDHFRSETSRAEPLPEIEGLQRQRLRVSREGSATEVDIIVYRPTGNEVLPGICCIHGGGFITGSAEKMASQRGNTALELNCVLVFVDYRLAPEHPYPAAIEDCYAALGWMFGRGSECGIDPSLIALYGISAGGGLAAALAILTRDRGEYAIAHQHLLCPMLDDRTVIERDGNPNTGAFVWTRANNRFGWAALLGEEPGGKDVTPYAAPSRIDDMSGLPPAYIAVGALDLFLEEDLDYARRLSSAGVPIELHVYPGVYHGANAILSAEVAQRWERDSLGALKRALGSSRRSEAEAASAIAGRNL